MMSIKSVAARTLPGIPHLYTPFIVTRRNGRLAQAYQSVNRITMTITITPTYTELYIAHNINENSTNKNEVPGNIITNPWASSRRAIADPVSTSVDRIDLSGEHVAIASRHPKAHPLLITHSSSPWVRTYIYKRNRII